MGYKIKRELIWVNEAYSDMQGPCPSGFHVPLSTEWGGLKTIMDGLSLTTGADYVQKLHIPIAGNRQNNSTADVYNVGTLGYYWCSTPNSGNSDYFIIGDDSSGVSVDSSRRCYGFTIRPFKNEFVIPDSSWTVVQGTLGGAGIFWNQTGGLISITSNGTTGYTIADKNLGATTVYTRGDTRSESNCGKYYQWGNNYGFPFSGSVTTSNTRVSTSIYGPGNYYNSSTFIYYTSGDRDWSNPANDNLRGGVSQQIGTRFVEKQIYPADKGWKPNANTILYAPLDSTNQAKDLISNTNMTTYGTIRYGTYGGCDCCDLTSYGGFYKSWGTTLGVYTIIVWCNDINGYYLGSGKSGIIRGHGTTALGVSYDSSGYYAWGNSNTYLNISTRNKWYMFVYQTNGTQATNKVWVYDGSTLTNTTNIDIYTNMRMMYIGNSDGNSQWFPGYISNVIIEHKYWTQDEIESFINQKKSYYGY